MATPSGKVALLRIFGFADQGETGLFWLATPQLQFASTLRPPRTRRAEPSAIEALTSVSPTEWSRPLENVLFSAFRRRGRDSFKGVHTGNARPGVLAPGTGDLPGSYRQPRIPRALAFRRCGLWLDWTAVAKRPSPEGTVRIDARFALGESRFQGLTLSSASEVLCESRCARAESSATRRQGRWRRKRDLKRSAL